MPKPRNEMTQQTIHLDWTNKQGRILTCEGKANEYYRSERGFPFQPEELPHHHLMTKSTYEAFQQFWNAKPSSSMIVCGAWKRPLFMGAWEHSTSNDEDVFNIQTNSLFIDLRIPKTKPVQHFDTIGKRCKTNTEFLETLSELELRLYSRQHVFSGYTVSSIEKGRPVGTRHHCIDWNFVGVPRSRPNKWYIEPQSQSHPTQVWKEWAYATNSFGQNYYCERWERSDGDDDGEGFVLAMRKAAGSERDGVLVAVGVS